MKTGDEYEIFYDAPGLQETSANSLAVGGTDTVANLSPDGEPPNVYVGTYAGWHGVIIMTVMHKNRRSLTVHLSPQKAQELIRHLQESIQQVGHLWRDK